jgi:N-acetylglucosaminyldiphosphoundecaprenol N-acetyl-beta-D-mannosaminyltransferase
LQGNLAADNRNLCTVLGLPFDSLTLDKAVAVVESSIENRRRCFLSTPNLNFVVQAHFNRAFYESVLQSDLVIADGMPIVLVARLLGLSLPERVAGSSLFEALANKPRTRPIRVFFFGGQGEAAQKAAANLAAISAGMEPCGYLNPGMGPVESMSDTEIIEQINAAEPDFLVVALGADKGQRWIMHNRERLRVSVISHLGAVINFVAGGVQRAPKKWQSFGLEWLWRIYQEPRLLRRYFYDGLQLGYLLIAKVLPLAIYQQVLHMGSAASQPLKIRVEQIDNCLEIHLSGAATVANCRLTRDCCNRALRQPCTILKHVRIDCADMTYIDSRSLALLLLFKVSLSRQGQSLRFFNLSPRTATLMNLHGVGHYLLE